jgi:cytochrome b561
MRVLAFAAGAALIGAPAFAQDWILDTGASSVAFETRAFNSPVTGTFQSFSADITLDPDDLSGARIDASVGTGSGRIANSDYLSAMTGAQGLAPGAHPEARFVSEDIRAVEDGYEAHGTLTIKGVDSEAVLPFTLTIDGERAIADAELSLDRTAFGVGGSGWGDVGALVTLTLHMEADRAQ